jgi:hypothetical protein
MEILGETADLNEFLFGTERAGLAAVRSVLMDIQHGDCFYCGSALKPAATDVDHFIAWARYPVDLGHNFVLADRACNLRKRDRLPAVVHLARWAERNNRYGRQIGESMEARGIMAELSATHQITQWAYTQAETAKALTWLRKDEMEPLDGAWRNLFF